MPARRQVKNTPSAPASKHKPLKKQQKKQSRHSLNLAEAETMTSLPEI